MEIIKQHKISISLLLQFIDSTNSRIKKNVESLSEVFANHETNFEDTRFVHNIITKTVLPHADAKRVLKSRSRRRTTVQCFPN